MELTTIAEEKEEGKKPNLQIEVVKEEDEALGKEEMIRINPNFISAATRAQFRSFRKNSNVFILVLLIIICMSLIMWNTTALETIIDDQFVRQVRLQNSSMAILYYDEVLTMSARSAAYSGNLAWQTRYDSFVDDIDREIKLVQTLSPEIAQVFFQTTDLANQRLVDLETQLFDAVAIGNLTLASSIIDGLDYITNKQILVSGINVLRDNVNHDRLKHESSANRLSVTSIVFAAITLCVNLFFAVFLWFFLQKLGNSLDEAVLTNFRRIMDEHTRRKGKINGTIQTLQSLVSQRHFRTAQRKLRPLIASVNNYLSMLDSAALDCRSAFLEAKARELEKLKKEIQTKYARLVSPSAGVKDIQREWIDFKETYQKMYSDQITHALQGIASVEETDRLASRFIIQNNAVPPRLVFQVIMNTSELRLLFVQFLQAEHSEENMNFMIDVESYQRAEPGKAKEIAQEIYEKYITQGAPKWINLSGPIRAKLVTYFGSEVRDYQAHLFMEAKEAVELMLSADSLRRFSESKYFETATKTLYSQEDRLLGSSMSLLDVIDRLHKDLEKFWKRCFEAHDFSIAGVILEESLSVFEPVAEPLKSDLIGTLARFQRQVTNLISADNRARLNQNNKSSSKKSGKETRSKGPSTEISVTTSTNSGVNSHYQEVHDLVSALSDTKSKWIARLIDLCEMDTKKVTIQTHVSRFFYLRQIKRLEELETNALKLSAGVRRGSKSVSDSSKASGAPPSPGSPTGGSGGGASPRSKKSERSKSNDSRPHAPKSDKEKSQHSGVRFTETDDEFFIL